MKRCEKSRMARCLLVLVFLLVGLWGKEAGAQFSQSSDYRRALEVISEKAHNRYPYLEGEVVAVKGADIYLSIGQKDRATKGVKLSVLRKGAPFKHPVTGVVLGTLEEEIGVAEIVDVREKFSVARMTKLVIGKDLVPKVKDKVRLSSAKIRIAVLPFINSTKEAFSTEILTRDLSRALLAKGRFDVYDVDRLQVWLLDSGIAVDDILKGDNVARLKGEIRRDLVMVNEIREVKGKKYLSSRIVELSSRKDLFKAVAIADELPFEQRAPREQALIRGGGGTGAPGIPNQSFVRNQTGIPGARGKTSNFLFSGQEFRGVAVSDVNQDGKNEVVIITTYEVIVYQIEGSRMREVARFNEGVGNDFRWIDVADMNGNGRPEIYIANYQGDELFSLVLELKGKQFDKLVKNRRVFFRVLQTRSSSRNAKLPDKEASLLLGQYQGIDKFLEGPISRYRWSGGKRLRQVAPYLLPENFEIVGFTLWDLEGDGSPEVVEIGKDDILRVFSRRGEVRHKSSARYGVPLNVFYQEAGGSNAEFEEDNPSLAIRSRLLVEDVDGDGITELLTIANEYGAGRMVPGLGVSSGSLVSLVWDGNGLSEIWRSQKVDGGIADFAYGDADNDGKKDLIVIAVGDDLFLSKVKSTIFLYRLDG